jgi:hypothetical protein
MQKRNNSKKFKFDNVSLYLIISILFIFLTNSYFSYSESLIYGGRDGFYYTNISKSFPKIATSIEYIKGERFFFPYLIGGISKILSADIFKIYQISIFYLITLIIFFIFQSLRKIKSSNFSIIISLSLLIFNPYMFRFFIAIPTIITDLIFILSSILIVNGFINRNKKIIFLGFAISFLSRQNGIFFLFSFFISKFYFKKKSLFNYKDIVYFISIFFIIFLLNSYYAINANSSEETSVKELYLTTLFGIFFDNYSFYQFILFTILPFLSFAPLIIFCFMQRNNFNKIILTELALVILTSSFLIFAIAFVSGPVVTGKNIIRLFNLCYPMLILLVNLYIKKKNLINKKSTLFNYIKFLITAIFFVSWSMHPTFSKLTLFDDLRFFFNFN